MLVTSKHGQEYQCKYLSHHEKSSRDKEEEKVAEEKGVVELLQPMRKAPCLLKVVVFCHAVNIALCFLSTFHSTLSMIMAFENRCLAGVSSCLFSCPPIDDCC